MSTQVNENEKKKRKKPYFLILILLLMVSITSSMVGYILGQRTAPLQVGGVIDTIVVQPPDQGGDEPLEETDGRDLSLSLSGRLVYEDGTPVANTLVELHSDPRSTYTDAQGSFFFYNVAQGDHTVYVKDDDGNVMASTPIAIDAENATTGLALTGDETTGYQLQVSIDVAVIELELNLNGEKLVIHPEKAFGITYDMAIVSSKGVTAKDDGHLISSNKNLLVVDDVIVVPTDGVLLQNGDLLRNDGQLEQSTGETLGLSDTTNVPEGFTVDVTEETTTITMPSGTEVVFGGEDEGTTLPDGTKITTDGTIIDPNGEIVMNGDDYDGILKVETDAGTGETTVTQPEPEPVTPDTPAVPDEPETPDEPVTPVTPDEPVEPDEPESPEIPDEPETPDEPDDPDVPDDPEIPTDPGDSGSSGGGGGGGGGSSSVTETPPVITETSSNQSWTQLTYIDLFGDAPNGVLYPGVEGSYQFQIQNPNSYALELVLSISEDTTYNSNALPLLYKIKVGDTYLTDDWQSGTGLELDLPDISAKGTTLYTIEWKWPYEVDVAGDTYDTALGSAENLSHIIKVTIGATEK